MSISYYTYTVDTVTCFKGFNNTIMTQQGTLNNVEDIVNMLNNNEEALLQGLITKGEYKANVNHLERGLELLQASIEE